MLEFKFLQNQVPKKFNLFWVRDTSKRYGLSDENTIVYNYLFYILLSFLFIFIILDFFFLNYYFTIIKTVLYYQIKTFIYCLIIGVIFCFNVLKAYLNSKTIYEISRLIKEEENVDEKHTLFILQSYFKLIYKINLLFCLFILLLYGYVIVMQDFVFFERMYNKFHLQN